MHPWPSNYSVDHKKLEHVPTNSSNHRSRVLSIESDAIDIAGAISWVPVQCDSTIDLEIFV